MIWNRRKPDRPEDDEPGPESSDSPQLSPAKGVPKDMSSLAIGGAFAMGLVLEGGRFKVPRIAETGE